MCIINIYTISKYHYRPSEGTFGRQNSPIKNFGSNLCVSIFISSRKGDSNKFTLFTAHVLFVYPIKIYICFPFYRLFELLLSFINVEFLRYYICIEIDILLLMLVLREYKFIFPFFPLYV